MKITIDFSEGNFPGKLPYGGIATREAEIETGGRSYRLIVVYQCGEYRISLRDEFGEPHPEFEVECMGERLRPAEGEEAVDLGKRSLAALATLEIHLGGKYFRQLEVFPPKVAMAPDEKEQAYLEREAWRAHFRQFTCPPLEVLRDGSGNAARHLASCKECRENLDELGLDSPWDRFVENLRETLEPPHASEIAPGQIRSLIRELDGWNEEGEYLRCSAVITVSVAGDEIRAVLCCPDIRLAREDDIVLDEGNGFAEPWNPVVLPKRALADCWGTVSEADLREVINNLNPREPKPSADWRGAFEGLERQIARFCEERARKMR